MSEVILATIVHSLSPEGRGWGEGARAYEKNPRLPNPLTPTLSPLGRGSSLCQLLLRTFMASASVLAARLGARVFFCARSRMDRVLGKYGHVKRETGPVQGKGRGGACLSVFRYVRFARLSFQETNK